MASRPTLRYAPLFVFFCAVAIIFARFSLQAPFFWDDLHLIRELSGSQLRQVWIGTYDVDQLETAGLRPLMTLFNHLRASALGYNAVAQHLLLVGLFCTYLTMAVAMARLLFGISFGVGVLAGLFTFLHLANVTHYAWLTDGVYLVSGIFMLGAILCLLQALRGGRLRWLPLSLLCVLCGLLVREDTVVVVALLPLFAVALIRQGRALPGVRRLPLLAYSAGLAAVVGVYFLWRAAVVPEAGLGTLRLPSLWWGILQTVQNLGDTDRLVIWWDGYITLIWLWTFSLGIVAAAILFLVPRYVQTQVAYWGAAIVATALPCILVARTNVLLFPITFWSLLLATVLVSLSKHSALGLVTAVAVAFLGLAGSAFGSTVFQADFTPSSIKWICEDTGTIYVNTKAKVPDALSAEVQQRLSTYGIDSADTLIRRLPQIIEQARQNRDVGPSGPSVIYIPHFRLLAHPWRYDAPCEGGQGWIFPPR